MPLCRCFGIGFARHCIRCTCAHHTPAEYIGGPYRDSVLIIRTSAEGALPDAIRKRLRYNFESDIYCAPAQMNCGSCSACVCLDAYQEVALVCDPSGFTPKHAFRYHPYIRIWALLVLLLRKRLPDTWGRLPRDLFWHLMELCYDETYLQLLAF